MSTIYMSTRVMNAVQSRIKDTFYCFWSVLHVRCFSWRWFLLPEVITPAVEKLFPQVHLRLGLHATGARRGYLLPKSQVGLHFLMQLVHLNISQALHAQAETAERCGSFLVLLDAHLAFIRRLFSIIHFFRLCQSSLFIQVTLHV